VHPIDRTLAATAGLLGILAFVLALGKSQQAGWVLPGGILCLFAGLTTASLIGRGRGVRKRRR
jgi:hypothetical protein